MHRFGQRSGTDAVRSIGTPHPVQAWAQQQRSTKAANRRQVRGAPEDLRLTVYTPFPDPEERTCLTLRDPSHNEGAASCRYPIE